MTLPLVWAGAVESAPPKPAQPTEDLLESLGTAVWRGDELARAPERTVPTGFPALDAVLPGSGWPSHALTELLQAQPAAVEFRLLAPVLTQVMAEGRQAVLVAPPRRPHLPGLRAQGLDASRLVWIRAETAAERLWSTEQLIKSGSCAMVAAWLPQARPEQIRRLHMCAQSCAGPVFVFRPLTAEREASAAPLRLIVRPGADWQLRVDVLKRRGAPVTKPIFLPSVPADLAPLVTPRLRRPSDIIRRRLRVAEPGINSTSRAVGSLSSQPGTVRVEAA